MAADALLLRTTTFLARRAWKKEYADGLRDNTLRLGRHRYTVGETVLAQADCEIGATHLGSDLIFRQYRISGTATADDEDRLLLATPYRGNWLWTDSEASPGVRGAYPPLDGRVRDGDSILIDTGSGDSYLQHYGAAEGRFWGRGVRAEYRTAATLSGKAQHSDRSTWRASSWSGSAVDRDFSARTYVRSPADASDIWEWRLSRLAAGGTERDVVRVTSDGELRLQGNADAAGIVLSSSLDGSGTVSGQFGYLTSTSTDPDQAACVFVHGQATKRAIWRFKNPTTGYTGFAAETITLRPYEEATLGDQLVNSPAMTLRGNYWNGASFSESGFYQQVVMTATTPEGHLEFGSNFGSGIHRFYGDGTFATSGAVLIGATAPSALRFDAAPGTHTALDAAAGGADAWIVVDKNGSDAYVPVFATKDLGIPTVPEPVYAELSLTDGSAASSITDGPNEWNPLAGFDAEGDSAGCDVDTVNGAITPVAGALFEVSLSVSFSGEAATEYVFAVAELVPPEGEGPPTFVQFTRQARVETIDTEKHSVSVTCLLNVTTGSALAPVVKSPTGATVGITLHEASFTIVKVDESTVS